MSVLAPVPTLAEQTAAARDHYHTARQLASVAMEQLSQARASGDLVRAVRQGDESVLDCAIFWLSEYLSAEVRLAQLARFQRQVWP